MKSIRGKVLLGFSIVVLLFIVYSAYSYFNIQKTTQNIERVTEERFPLVVAKGELVSNVQERLSLAQGYLLTGNQNYARTFEELTEASQEIEEQLATLSEDPVLDEYLKINENWSALIVDEVFPSYVDGEISQASRIMSSQGTPMAMSLITYLQDTASQERETMGSQLKEAQNLGLELQRSVIVATLVTMLGSVMVALMIARIITKPIHSLLGQVSQIAKGDLSGEDINVKSKDEIGQLAKAFDEMKSHLRSLIGKTKEMSDQVTATAQELSASSQESVTVTNQVATTIQDVSEQSMDTVDRAKASVIAAKEMSAGVERITFATADVSIKADEAASHAEDGERSIERAIEQIDTAQHSVQQSATFIKQLGERSSEIGSILELIHSIAEQTNLLALNAAIEAARAGEHGKGFAVVADEVRKLAEESGRSANQISKMLATIQQDTEKAIQEMDKGQVEVEKGTKVVGDAGATFAKITASIAAVNEQMLDVSTATQQIARNTIELSDSIQNMEQASMQNADHSQTVAASTEEQLSSMEEIAYSAEQLSNLAAGLQEEINRFKL